MPEALGTSSQTVSTRLLNLTKVTELAGAELTVVVGQEPSPACSQAAYPGGDQETRDKVAGGCEDGRVSRTGWLMPLKSLERHRSAGTHRHLACLGSWEWCLRSEGW